MASVSLDNVVPWCQEGSFPGSLSVSICVAEQWTLGIGVRPQPWMEVKAEFFSKVKSRDMGGSQVNGPSLRKTL